MRTADIQGPQRKVVGSSVRPVKARHGAAGIAVKDGRSLPFVVWREWSAPEGYYAENFYVVHPQTREILFEGPEQVRLMWGLQGLTEVSTTVERPFSLEPGRYLLIFALGGMQGGELEFDAVEVEEEAA